MMRALVLGLALALAPAPAFAQSAEAFSTRLAQLPPMQRLAALRRAILDSGQLCKRPTDAVRGGQFKNLLMWSVRCVPGGDYSVFLGPSGLVQVRPCKQHAQLRLPACRLPPAPPAAPAKPRR